VGGTKVLPYVNPTTKYNYGALFQKRHLSDFMRKQVQNLNNKEGW